MALDDPPSKMAKFDDSQYDVVVFDEIFFSSVRKLARIKRYCDKNPEKIVIATGDTSQLECIDQITNQHDYDEYYNRCIDQIFPKNMYFRENKRLKSKKDKDTLGDVKRDIFDEDIPIETTIKKYFGVVADWKTTYNIAYFNTTCCKVSGIVRDKILKKDKPYEVGEILICRDYFKIKKMVFQVNYEYAISGVAADSLTLDGSIVVPISLVQKHFIHNYCRTCHSLQGSSVEDEITIFDWKDPHVTRKWIYTAITRATDLKKVKFHKYDVDLENKRQVMQYFQRKVDRYKA